MGRGKKRVFQWQDFNFWGITVEAVANGRDNIGDFYQWIIHWRKSSRTKFHVKSDKYY